MADSAHANNWEVGSWKQYPIKQQPQYPEEAQGKLEEVLSYIRSLPPLVVRGEIESLKTKLAAAGRGEAFILQGGDCAERFVDCTKESIENKMRIILQMSLVLIWTTHLPVVRIIRGAGQFAKPRSSPIESITTTVKETNEDGSVVEKEQTIQIPSFRGDNINGFGIHERTPDPERLLRAYFHSATTINYLRALVSGGFASLKYPHKWDLNFIKSKHTRDAYTDILNQLDNGIKFISTISSLASDLSGIDVFTSHEGLILSYEEANTFAYNQIGAYNLGTHFIWVGDRTREIGGAHIEYFRGIENPVGLKCGPSLDPEELRRLLPILNPHKKEGKLVLISRFGADKVAGLLPKHIQVVREIGIPVTWICDPMHGNTIVADNGLKTRKFNSIWKEIEETLKVHHKNGSILGGIHLEMTGENVTECTGGSPELDSSELSTAYETYCDPRLNYTQSLDIAFRVAELLNSYKTESAQREEI